MISVIVLIEGTRRLTPWLCEQRKKGLTPLCKGNNGLAL